MPEPECAIRQWLEKIVIGFNFCPFAKREFDAGNIRFSVVPGKKKSSFIRALSEEFTVLDTNTRIETSLLIFADGLKSFSDYLDLMAMAHRELLQRGYEGIYQLASFHPDYLFADSDQDDAANYTNRSPYPVIHVLREASVEQAIASHKDTGLIPERNITFARGKGLGFWREMLEAIQGG